MWANARHLPLHCHVGLVEFGSKFNSGRLRRLNTQVRERAEPALKLERRGSKGVMQRIANPFRLVRVQPAPPVNQCAGEAVGSAWNVGMNEAIQPRVFLIKVQHLAFVNNNYLIVDPASRQAVVVDPAWEMGKIQGELERAQATLSGILITHSHHDHINLAKPMAELYNCPIWMSQREVDSSGFSARHLVPLAGAPVRVGAMEIQPILTP